MATTHVVQPVRWLRNEQNATAHVKQFLVGATQTLYKGMAVVLTNGLVVAAATDAVLILGFMDQDAVLLATSTPIDVLVCKQGDVYEGTVKTGTVLAQANLGGGPYELTVTGTTLEATVDIGATSNDIFQIVGFDTAQIGDTCPRVQFKVITAARQLDL